MTLLAFLLGLVLGIGYWLWQQRRTQRELGQMLGTLQTDTSSTSMSVVSRLRREITLANYHRQELENQLQIRQRLLQVAPFGYLQVDEENRLLWCNEQARQLLQINRWEPGQIRLLLELVRSYELDQLIEQTRQRQQPDIRQWEFHPPCLDGEAMSEVRSLTLRASSWPLPEGQIGVFLENQQPLVELAQSRNQWFGDLAHELRTPLTSIRLVAEALQGHLEPPKSRWVEKLLHETNRLIHLVQDWLELSNLEKNPSKSLRFQPLELRSLIQSAWQTLEPLAQLHQLTLAYDGPDTLWLSGDASRLTQVFVNLFDNSIKHSPVEGAIRVEVTCLEAGDVKHETNRDRTTPFPRLKQNDPGSTQAALTSSLGLVNQGEPLLGASVVASPSGLANSKQYLAEASESEHCSLIQINIIDSGAGFSETDLPHVFKRLYRGDASRNRQPVDSLTSKALGRSSGSGLGLSIVQQIVQAHSGSVEARNHPETGGAWLQLKLPDRKISP